MNSLIASLHECAAAAAKAGGDHVMRNIRRRTDTLKTTSHDVKLKLDVETQAVIAKMILERFPAHRILGEEDEAAGAAPAVAFCDSMPDTPARGGEHGVLWIVDPIDGTVNFYHGLPIWCCSVAAAIGGRIAAGAVYAPEMEEAYTARLGAPSECNGKPLAVSGTARLSESLVVTGLDWNTDTAVPPLAFFNRISSAARKVRILGSAALDMCAVAAGKADGYFEAGVYIWDVAAAGLVIRQAGGRCDVEGRYSANRICVLADNGLIHDEFLSLAKPVLARV